MGHGHSGDSSGRGAEISNPIVQQKLTGDITQYANSLGLNLSPEQITQVIDKVFPKASQFQDGSVAYDAQREAAYQNAKQFILPTLQTFAVNNAKNPVLTPEVIGQNDSAVNNAFQKTLGRDATPDEKDFFSKEIAQGIHPYEIQQALQGSPEYQKQQADLQQQKYTQQAQAAQDALNQNLMQTQQQVFEKATPAIIASYMKAGRLNSSGLNSALANAQKELDQQRQSFLGQQAYQTAVQGAGYNQQNFVNNAGQAFQTYLNAQAPIQNQRQAVQGLSNNLKFGGAAQGILNRQNELADYNMQRNDYLNSLNSQKSNPWIGVLQGALGGAAVGAKTGNPYGALYGAGLGGAGGYAAYQ